MYRVKHSITSLAHGKIFDAGSQLYGNEFPEYALKAMLADGTIEEIGAEAVHAAEPEPSPVEVEAVGPITTVEPEADDNEDAGLTEIGEPVPDELMELKALADLIAEDEAALDEAPLDEQPAKKGRRNG